MDNFFQQAYEEENVVETPVEETSEQSEQVEQQEVETQEETKVDTPQEEVKEETAEPQKIKIEGLGEFTIEEIKEMQSGYMRQSDYTKKTQELAKQRKELEALRNTGTPTPTMPPNNNPVTQVEQRIQELEQKLADKELDDEISRLKNTYPDFDEVKVLTEAYERGVTDLEFVYRATREEKQVDVQTLEQQIREKVLKELAENKALTSSIVTTGATPVTQRQPNITPDEMAICEEFGLSVEEYYKYK